MKRKFKLIPICVIAGIVAVCAVVVLYMSSKSLGFSVGRCLVADNGDYMLICKNFPIKISDRTNSSKLFKKLENGDKILVLHDGIQESYPAATGAYAVLKLSDGDISDISESVLKQLSELGWLTDDAEAVECITSGEEQEAFLSPANYYDGSELYTSALNSDKMAISSVQHLPIHKLETPDDLERFKSAFGGELAMDRTYNDIPSFESVTKDMDKAFFEKYTVFVTYVPANSGSLRFGVNSIYNDGENLCIHIQQTNDPQAVTMDMVGWFVTVPIEKTLVEGCTSFDADLNNLSD